MWWHTPLNSSIWETEASGPQGHLGLQRQIRTAKTTRETLFEGERGRKMDRDRDN